MIYNAPSMKHLGKIGKIVNNFFRLHYTFGLQAKDMTANHKWNVTSR